MCGIIGSINIQLDRGILDDLAHRGPDDRGWEEIRIANHTVTLGHTRLAIQDTSQYGHQPMLSEQGALVFNGEIYNHRELRDRTSDYVFSSHSDTETLLALLERNPRVAIAELNGIFAFAYLDKRNHRLLLARDSFGVKPLYYALSGDTLAFCSEIAPLIRIAGDEVDLDSLALVLRYRSSYAPRSIYRRIRKLLPGTCLELDLKEERLAASTWRFSTRFRDDPQVSIHEAVDIYQQSLHAAIERQLLSDIEIGIFLSGGVDSALIASHLSKALPYRPKAFTVGFEAGSENELNDAAATARHVGLDHHMLTIKRKDFFALFREAARSVEEPTSTTSIVPLYALAQLASQHVHVVLSGQGADECNAGYARYRAELLTGPITALLARTISSVFGKVASKPHKLFTYLSHRDEFRRYLSSHEIFTKEEVDELLGLETSTDLQPPVLEHDFTDQLNRIIGYDLRYNLPDDLLLYTDKITMRFSLECRVPFLDNELVSFLMSLPGRYKANLLGGKLLHKEVARRSLPDFLVNRKKKGFLVPTSTWFRNSREHWDILLSRHGRFDSIFNPKQVEAVLSRHERGENLEKQIMLLMSCQAILGPA